MLRRRKREPSQTRRDAHEVLGDHHLSHLYTEIQQLYLSQRSPQANWWFVGRQWVPNFPPTTLFFLDLEPIHILPGMQSGPNIDQLPFRRANNSANGTQTRHALIKQPVRVRIAPLAGCNGSKTSLAMTRTRRTPCDWRKTSNAEISFHHSAAWKHSPSKPIYKHAPSMDPYSIALLRVSGSRNGVGSTVQNTRSQSHNDSPTTYSFLLDRYAVWWRCSSNAQFYPGRTSTGSCLTLRLPTWACCIFCVQIAQHIFFHQYKRVRWSAISRPRKLAIVLIAKSRLADPKRLVIEASLTDKFIRLRSTCQGFSDCDFLRGRQKSMRGWGASSPCTPPTTPSKEW